MIGILINSGIMYRFPNLKVAEIWMDEYPEKYGHDKNNLSIFANEVSPDSIELQEKLYIRTCNGCDRYIKFTVGPDEKIDSIICPNCDYDLGPP